MNTTSSKNFVTLSQVECCIVYKEILKHSDEKWETQALLASNGHYGTAISTAILSLEELIKAMVIFADSKGFRVRSTKGMESFFRDHQIRYVFGYLMFVICVFGDDAAAFFKSNLKRRAALTELLQRLKTRDKWLMISIERYLRRRIILLRSELSWFSKMDMFRQDGFYTRYAGTLKTPGHTTEEDYRDVVLRLTRVRAFGKNVLDAMDGQGPETVEAIRNAVKTFELEGGYQHLADVLATIGKGKQRQDPFEAIRERFFVNV